MKYSLLTYWNMGFGILMIIQAYALYFMNIELNSRIVQLLAIASFGLVLVTIGAMVGKKQVKINQSKIQEQA